METAILYEDTIKNELIKPANLGELLMESGLKSIDVSIEEYMLAEQYNARYRKPSIHDCMALAVAKERNITLLTGDGALKGYCSKTLLNMLKRVQPISVQC